MIETSVRVSETKPSIPTHVLSSRTPLASCLSVVCYRCAAVSCLLFVFGIIERKSETEGGRKVSLPARWGAEQPTESEHLIGQLVVRWVGRKILSAKTASKILTVSYLFGGGTLIISPVRHFVLQELKYRRAGLSWA